MQRRATSRFYKSRNEKSVEPKPPRSRHGFGWYVLSGLKILCLVIGATFLFSIVMGIFAASLMGETKKVSLPSEMILVLNVTSPIGETQNSRSFADPFSAPDLTVHELIAALDRASEDKRVHGLLVSLDVGGLELSHIQEIRDAVKRFRAGGKFAYLYTASFADLGSGIGAYYLASSFDKIWMQPVGMLSMTGVSLEMPFAKKALEKVGARAQFLHREEYKSAMESFTNDTISPANKEMSASLIDSITRRIADDIIADRKLEPSVFNQNLNMGLLTGKRALQERLIDKLDYADVLIKEARIQTGNKDIALVDVVDYYDGAVSAEPSRKSNVALVRIAGEIVPGEDPEPGYATADYIASAIKDAADNKHIKVIVLRVDSPGGSPTASETIRRAIVKAKEKDKKIVVSMGPLAASGGYWITVDADHIFAMPSTLTGSIGVIMGKFEISGLWEKLGVNWDATSWGQNARMWSVNRPISESENVSLNAAIDDTYQSFIERVAWGRKMDVRDVRKIAKGRAWTGLQAKEIGLVDDIGGLDSAMDYAAKLVGTKDRKGLTVIELPKPLSPMEQLMHMMGQKVLLGHDLSKIPEFKAVGPYLRQMNVMERIGPVQTYDPVALSVQ